MKATVAVNLTANDIVLLRCGLIRRMDNLKDRPECKPAYDQSKVLLEMLWHARLQIIP